MQINKTIETPEGIIKFEGELSQEEADTVISIGLTSLLNAGFISYTIAPPEEDIEVDPATPVQ